MVKMAALFPGESNLMSVTPLRVATLAANNDTNNSNSSCCNSKHSFNPSLPYAILVLFCFFFFMCLSSIFSRCRSTNWDTTRQRGSGHNIMEVLNRQAPGGLDRAVIESFPVFSYSLVKRLTAPAKCSDCAVCLTDFQEDEMLRLLPQCSHSFHPDCIDSWLFTHTTCPVCRSNVVLSDDSVFTPIHLGLGLVEPQRPPEEGTVVIDNGGEVNLLRTTNGAPFYDLTGSSSTRDSMDQPTQWYIATAEGLTPGLCRNCNFVGCAEYVSRSERWGHISIHPASVFRTFSERISTRATGELGVEEEDEKGYLKRTFSSLMGKEDGTVRLQSESVSSKHADHFDL